MRGMQVCLVWSVAATLKNLSEFKFTTKILLISQKPYTFCQKYITLWSKSILKEWLSNIYCHILMLFLIKNISFVTTDICLVHLMRKLSLLKRNKLISSFEQQKILISNFWLNFNWLDLLENKARLQSVLMTAQELVMKRSLYSRVGGGRWEEKSNIFFQKV